MGYNKWTEEESQFLKDNYPTMKLSELTNKLGRDKEQIRSKSQTLGLRKVVKSETKRRFWTEKEVKFLTENYPKLTLFEIGKKLERDPITVKAKAIALEIYYEKERVKVIRRKFTGYYEPSSIRALNENYGTKF